MRGLAMRFVQFLKPHHHGTAYGYTLGCRCDPCRMAKRAYQTAYYRRRHPRPDPPAPTYTWPELVARELDRLEAARTAAIADARSPRSPGVDGRDRA